MPIAIVSVPVTDQTRARDFYRDVLRFEVLREEEMGPEMRWIQLQPKDGGATIALTTWHEKLKPGGQQGLLIGINDIDTEHARIKNMGVRITDIDEQPWGRFAMLEDPDGNGWVLTEMTHPEEVRSK